MKEAREEVESSVREWQDPHQKAMTRRENEALDQFQTQGKARTEFSQEWGQYDHERWMEERRQQETAKGRVQGRDFDVNVCTMRHPDGGKVQLDYVDYENDTIVDRKPMAEGETPQGVANKYEHQRERHIAAYEHSTGRQAEYKYDLSPSSSDLAKREADK